MIKKILLFSLIGILLIGIPTSSIAKTYNGSETRGNSRHMKTKHKKTKTMNKEDHVMYQLEQLEILKEQLIDIKDLLNDEYISTSERNEIIEQLEDAIQQVDDLVDYRNKDDYPKVIKGEVLLIPTNVVIKNLGADIQYDNETGLVIITKGDNEIIFYIDSNIAIVNGVKKTIEGNGIIVPIDFIIDYFEISDADIKCDELGAIR